MRPKVDGCRVIPHSWYPVLIGSRGDAEMRRRAFEGVGQYLLVETDFNSPGPRSPMEADRAIDDPPGDVISSSRMPPRLRASA